MASLIPGYEYDLFISYRQKDNKYDGWVTEFVNNLRKELESTFKEDISVYFDINPHDGLLETYSVDKSLEGKLKSIIFIPIISRTYCDPKSFAWQHEFVAFNKLAMNDRFGRDLKLANGNVASRILPLKIYDLDPDDLILLENELGSTLRSVEFIFKSPGVNRPLKSDDSRSENLNHTYYRDQINKIANSVKEIIISIQNPDKFNLPPLANLHKADTSAKSIAVLPFVNMSNDPEQEYFSDGISEEIINMLVQIPTLKVAGRTSAFSFKNKDEDLRLIGEKLNVNTILEGSVRKSGKSIRITAQLIEVSTGFHLWSQKFDRELNDVFIIQDEIARAIADQLQLTLGGKPAMPKGRLQTQNVEAYQLYLKGMVLFYKRGLHMFEGIRCFEDALKIDPDYALALAGMADSYTMLCFHSYMPPEEAWPKASAAAKRAIKLGPELAEVHNATATIALLFEHDWTRAEKEYENALKLNPRYLQARGWYAYFYLLLVRRDHDTALKHARLTVEYDPLSSYAQGIVSVVASAAGLYDEAIAAGKRSVEYDQESFVAWFFLGYCNHYAGNIASAIQAYQQAINISGRHNWTLTFLLSILLEQSEYQNIQEANYIYRELLSKEKTGYVNPFLLAIASAALGKNEDAVRYISQAIDRHDPLFPFALPGRPDNKALRKIPKIVEIMKSIGLY
jgi:TolB-like protein/Tfp pilus assembly protein PilF